MGLTEGSISFHLREAHLAEAVSGAHTQCRHNRRLGGPAQGSQNNEHAGVHGFETPYGRVLTEPNRVGNLL